MENSTKELTANNIQSLQLNVIDLRKACPNFIRQVSSKKTQIELDILEKTNYVTDTEEFSIPEIKHPFDDYDVEALKMSADMELKATLNKQIKLMKFFIKRKGDFRKTNNL